MWTSALKALPLASQETCAAMEFYHNQLKLRLLNEKNSAVYQRTDWLVDKLGTKVHSYFWLDEYSGKDDFARYWKDEWVSGLTCWRKALMIPDSDVVVEGRCAKVVDQVDREITHVVLNPGSEYGICDCSWAKLGNLCEHLFKVMGVCRSKGLSTPSISFFQYSMTLIKMLHCPPYDSLTRDHALSLAVSVQKQVNMLNDINSDKTSENVAEPEAHEQQSFRESSAKENEETLNDKTSQIDSSRDGSIRDNSSGSMVDLSATRHGFCDGNSIKETSCADMDIDPVAICASPAGLVSVDDVISGDVFSQKVEGILTSVNHKMSEEQLSDEALSKKNTNNHDLHCENYHESMDLDPLSTPGSLDQCIWTNQNDGPEPVIISGTPDTDLPSGKSSASRHLPHSQAVNKVEAPYLKENEKMEVEEEDNSSSLLPSKDASVIDGYSNNLTNASNLVHDAEVASIMIEGNPRSSSNCPPSFAQRQDDSTVETCVADEPSLISEHTINRCDGLRTDDERSILNVGSILPTREIKYYYVRRKNRK